jgi:hypothetical protein
MEALGISLVVGGLAFLMSGLIFLLPSQRKQSVKESQEEPDELQSQ